MGKPIRLPVLIHYYSLAILLLCVALQIRLGFSWRNMFALTLAIFCVTIFPFLRDVYTPLEGGSEALSFKIFCIIILLVIAIFLSRIPTGIKIILVTILVLLYWRHLYLWARVITILISLHNMPKSLRYDNLYAGKYIRQTFSYCGFRLVHNFGALPTTSTIFVANYCADRIENIAYVLIPGKTCVISQFPLLDNILYRHIRSEGHGSGQFERMKIKIADSLKRNVSIFTYINAPTHSERIGKLNTGMFRIAAELGVSITPICIDRIVTGISWTIPTQNFCVRVGESFKPDSLYTSVYKVRKFFSEALTDFEKNKFNFNYSYT